MVSPPERRRRASGGPGRPRPARRQRCAVPPPV